MCLPEVFIFYTSFSQTPPVLAISSVEVVDNLSGNDHDAVEFVVSFAPVQLGPVQLYGNKTRLVDNTSFRL